MRKLILFLLIIGVSPMSEGMDLSDVKKINVGSIPLILKSTKAFDDIVALNITAKGGVSITEKAGLLDLLDAVLTAGTYSYSKETIDKELTRTGAHFSISAHSDYFEVNLKCLKKYLPTLLEPSI